MKKERDKTETKVDGTKKEHDKTETKVDVIKREREKKEHDDLKTYIKVFEIEHWRAATETERIELRARLAAGLPPLDTMELLTVSEYAERENISTQAVYKRINAGKAPAITISSGDNRYRRIIARGPQYPYGENPDYKLGPEEKPQQSDVQQDGPALIGVDARAELEKLRAENEKLRAQLDDERATARAQSDRILSLAERLADLTAASQVLLQQQQQAGKIAAHVVEYDDAAAKAGQPEAAAGTADNTANPQPVADLSADVQPAESATPAPEQQTEPAEQPKKGFFARLFGT